MIVKHYLIIILLLMYTICYGQSYEYVGSSLFGIQEYVLPDTTSIAIKYDFIDIDNDLDLDLIMTGYNLSDSAGFPPKLSDLIYFMDYQENIGSKWNPKFSSRQQLYNDFSFPSGESFFLPSIGDVNGDKLIDFIVSAKVDSNNEQSLLFYEQEKDQNFNMSESSDWDLNTFFPLSLFIPELVDLDVDGDLDILLSGYYPSFFEDDENTNIYLYAKNTGDRNNPSFDGWYGNPYNLETDTIQKIITTGDIDLDNDIDILGVSFNEENSHIYYYENLAGTDGRPLFNGYVESPFGLPMPNVGETYLFPTMCDIDADGDIDIFFLVTNDTSFSLDFYENKLCAEMNQIIDDTICQGDTFYLNNQFYTETGTYIINNIGSDGCISTTKLNLIVLPNSSYKVTDTLCLGEIYKIANNEIRTTGTYEFKIMSQSGCDSIILADLTFLEIDVSVSLNGIIVTATKKDDYSYQWFDCNSGMDIPDAVDHIYTVQKSGEYGVRIENKWSCIDTSNCIQVIITSTKDINLNNHLSLNPNPSFGKLTVINETDLAIKGIAVFDISGYLVLSPKLINNQIILTPLRSGFYIVQFDLGPHIIIKNIVHFQNNED